MLCDLDTETYYITSVPAVWWFTFPWGVLTLDSWDANEATVSLDLTNYEDGYAVGIVAMIACPVNQYTAVEKYFDLSLCGRSSSSSGSSASRSSAQIPSNYVLAYPNPATNILSIEISVELAIQAQLASQVAAGVRGGFAISTDFDVRLFDNQGNMVRQTTSKGGAVQFNVANLPMGIYHLHVHDGVSKEPEVHQIVVER